jgi:hypothetical protein
VEHGFASGSIWDRKAFFHKGPRRGDTSGPAPCGFARSARAWAQALHRPPCRSAEDRGMPLHHPLLSAGHARRAAWLALSLFTAVQAWALAPSPVEQVRAAEQASCAPGEMTTWADGQDRPAATRQVRLRYRHDGAPARFSEADVRAALQRALTAWSDCGIPAVLFTAAAAASVPASPGDVQVAWDDAGTRGNFALADLGQRRLWLSAGMFALLAERNPRHPADQTLQMAISHELGHFFGLVAHSRRCIDVMSYYHDGQGHFCSTRDGGSYRTVPEYRALLPTACDIARCRAVNGVR